MSICWIASYNFLTKKITAAHSIEKIIVEGDCKKTKKQLAVNSSLFIVNCC